MKENNNKPKEQLPKDQQKEQAPDAAENNLKEKKEDYTALWDKYVRACADFLNARKRWEKEKEEIIKFSNSSLLKDLLIVLDETEQALKMVKAHTNVEEILKGLEMTYNTFINILKKRGLTVIEALGKDFDPHIHEIVDSKEVEDNIQKPIVLEEIQKGYMLENKVLRPARVVVGIKKEAKPNNTNNNQLEEGAA